MDWEFKLKCFVMKKAGAGFRHADRDGAAGGEDESLNTANRIVTVRIPKSVKPADKPGSVVDSHSSRRFVT